MFGCLVLDKVVELLSVEELFVLLGVVEAVVVVEGVSVVVVDETVVVAVAFAVVLVLVLLLPSGGIMGGFVLFVLVVEDVVVVEEIVVVELLNLHRIYALLFQSYRDVVGVDEEVVVEVVVLVQFICASQTSSGFSIAKHGPVQHVPLCLLLTKIAEYICSRLASTVVQLIVPLLQEYAAISCRQVLNYRNQKALSLRA